MLDVIIVGAGPYGISLAAHAVANKLEYKLFGYPMDFWKNQMPQDMFIRTPHDFVSFSDPLEQWTIHNYALETGTLLETPLPRPVFVDYASWFAEKTGITFSPVLVSNVEQKDGYFTVRTETGEEYQTKNVIVATGVEHYKYLPESMKEVSSNLLSHTSGYTDFSQFKGKKVAVIGSGQSAWEAAGLLNREQAEVELIYRRKGPNYAGSRENEILLRDLGEVFYTLPLKEKKTMWGQSPGSVAHFLEKYVEGLVPQTGEVGIESLTPISDDEIKITLTNGEEKKVNHIIVATGFRINLDRVPFMDQKLLQKIEREELPQFPKLSEFFESNIQGLYFAGPLSSHSHGPTFRFILGLKKTSSTILKSITRELVKLK
ncbi:NAD(P)-binding domain-containing protein [Peribacillus acanthi]|uniref:NAD(P)-binding domain-containing protein n=1 Tax=Peribacillus acanthi TaxID=2171554 RepID=UPI000D3E0E5A|nr:NAD(P)-binding domain-containing protein [Peribacillus acanthi]